MVLAKRILVSGVVLLSLVACDGTSGDPETVPLPLAVASVTETADHIARDQNGSYFCVLRRPADLAELRAQFTG